MNTDLIHQLFDEYTLWYANLVKERVNLPRSVSGVSEDGKQFTLIVDRLNIDHIERHNFIKSVLESEQSIAYVYGSLMMSGTDKKDEFEETLAIIAANSQHYVWGEWRVFRNSDGNAIGLQHSCTHEGDEPDDNPGAWFLTNALKFSKKDRAKFEGIWKNIRKDAQFRNRNDFGSRQTSDKAHQEEATQVGTDRLLRAPELEQLGRVTTVVQPLPLPIMTNKTPREVLVANYGSVDGALPIRGGWGYTKEDACIIDKNDSIVDPSLPFDGIGVEKMFVEKRIYEEMIIFRPHGEKFSGIEWNLMSQHLVPDDGRHFDKLVYEITAFRDNDWEELKAEFEGPNGYESPDFDQEAHEKKRQERMVRFTRDFWFDITSFYGQGAVITDKSTGKKEDAPINYSSDNFFRIHAILMEYVSIHDEIFKPSLRKSIHIPGFFKPINFCKHLEDLGVLSKELGQIAISTDHENPHSIFQEYVTALFSTILELRVLCGKLSLQR